MVELPKMSTNTELLNAEFGDRVQEQSRSNIELQNVELQNDYINISE